MERQGDGLGGALGRTRDAGLPGSGEWDWDRRWRARARRRMRQRRVLPARSGARGRGERHRRRRGNWAVLRRLPGEGGSFRRPPAGCARELSARPESSSRSTPSLAAAVARVLPARHRAAAVHHGSQLIGSAAPCSCGSERRPVPSGRMRYQCGSGSSARKWANTIRPSGSQALAPSAPRKRVRRC